MRAGRTEVSRGDSCLCAAPAQAHGAEITGGALLGGLILNALPFAAVNLTAGDVVALVGPVQPARSGGTGRLPQATAAQSAQITPE
ncbi:hypothetical protein [Ensifer aridi]|uniref:hypothetical protein n=1 Tax=Ensifer aridi TaxID=1708715 RepID=UPI0004027B76|nr:hypothetical protein [Ensifer aridi]